MLFNEKELKKYKHQEGIYLIQARNGNASPLFMFWQIKREEFLRRSKIRNYGE